MSVVRALLLGCLFICACSKTDYAVGDQAIVEQEGKAYEAKILSVEKDGKFKVSYFGYNEEEVVAGDRMRAKVPKAGAVPAWSVGDMVLVLQGKVIYEAKILSQEKDGKFKVAYVGYNETETVKPDRVRAAAPKGGLNLSQPSSGKGSSGSAAAADEGGGGGDKDAERIAKCKQRSGYDWCDNNWERLTSSQHCGRCGNWCTSMQECRNGTCEDTGHN